MVLDIIKNTKKNIKKNKIQTIEDVYRSQYPLISFSNKMRIFDENIKSFLKKNIL